MSKIFRDKTLGSSKRRNNIDFQVPMQLMEPLLFPFGPSNLSNSELQETTYKILVGACRSSNIRLLEKPERAPTIMSSASL